MHVCWLMDISAMKQLLYIQAMILMNTLLLNTGEPMPTAKLLIWTIAIIIVLVLLKAARQKVVASKETGNNSVSWKSIADILRLVYIMSLVYLVYIIIDWLLL